MKWKSLQILNYRNICFTTYIIIKMLYVVTIIMKEFVPYCYESTVKKRCGRNSINTYRYACWNIRDAGVPYFKIFDIVLGCLKLTLQKNLVIWKCCSNWVTTYYSYLPKNSTVFNFCFGFLNLCWKILFCNSLAQPNRTTTYWEMN